jgi:hypothetical protein
MRNQVLRDYLFHVVPAFVIPIGLYLSDKTLTPNALFKIGLLALDACDEGADGVLSTRKPAGTICGPNS